MPFEVNPLARISNSSNATYELICSFAPDVRFAKGDILIDDMEVLETLFSRPCAYGEF